MENSFVYIKQKVTAFFKEQQSYSNYGSELRSDETLYGHIYDVAPRRYLGVRYIDDKYACTPYYAVKTTKFVEDGKVLIYDKFMESISKQVEFCIAHINNETVYLFTIYGFIKFGVDSDTGKILRMKINSISDEFDERLSKIVIDSVADAVEDDKEGEKNHYHIAYVDEGSIETMESEFDDWSSDIKKNYNDNLPYDEMNENIRANKSSLMLMYGEPGTGKSSLIKSLVNDNLGTEFIYVDSSLFTSLSNGQFLSFLNEHRGAVFILEDCETALKSRNEGPNEYISTILNITDGIVAESLKCKFICTFNCPKEKIDDALLRKGRLSILYEFKKLTLEKTRGIYPEADKEMTLAEAYNATNKVDYTEKKQRKIGF